MVRKKSGSRRQSLKDKYKIEKKCKEHKKKLRKQARLAGPSKKPKEDPGIPNLWPYKDKLIAKMARDREKAVDTKLKVKNERNGMMARLKRAQATSTKGDEEEKGELETETEQNYAKRRWYFKEMNKVLHMADIILEVVDARDPMGCRCKEIEQRVQQMAAAGSKKRIIIVLNKIDLVPAEIVTQWTKYLRREFPTVAFKSSTQQQGSKLSQAPVKLAKASEELLNSGKCVGASALMQLLKNYCRNQDVKTAVNVGIIGYPNVGKSSVINSLKRSRVAGVGATPGFTKTISAIRLDKYINLLDSPGVLFSADCSQSDLVLRNCIKLEQCEDPLAAVHAIVDRCPREQLMQLYKISEYSSPDEFASHVAHKRGKIKKGGVPNLIAASRTILKDWTTGFIPFYTLPPATTANIAYEEKEIVEGWAQEFNLDEVEKVMYEEIASSASAGRSDFMQIKANAPLTMVEEVAGGEDEDEDEDGSDEGMDEDEDDETSSVRLAMKPDKKVKGASAKQANPILPEQQQQKTRKKEQKNQKKQEGEEEEEDTGMGGAYDFGAF